jgi:hypothetical protein
LQLRRAFFPFTPLIASVIVENGYHCSARFLEEKRGFTLNSPRFFHFQFIPYIVVMAFGAKPVISPTNQQKSEAQKTCDIIHPSS